MVQKRSRNHKGWYISFTCKGGIPLLIVFFFAVCSLQSRRFYFAVNASGEILSSLDKASVQCVTPRAPGPTTPITIRKAQSSSHIMKSPVDADPLDQPGTPTRDFARKRVTALPSQDVFRRTQSANEVSKARADEAFPAIGATQESPTSHFGGRPGQGSGVEHSPALSPVESKISPTKFVRGRPGRIMVDPSSVGLNTPSPTANSTIRYYSVSAAPCNVSACKAHARAGPHSNVLFVLTGHYARGRCRWN